jgi:hypothetical protein
MKVPTAVNERIENLGKPQIPCPLVQPLANLVPNPTSRPPITRPSVEVFNDGEIVVEERNLITAPELIKPSKYEYVQFLLFSTGFFVSASCKIPEIPVSFPET